MALGIERMSETIQQFVDFIDDRLNFIRHIGRYRAQVGLRAPGQFLAQLGQGFQARADAEPDHPEADRDQQHFRQQHAEQDFAYQCVALDHRLTGQHREGLAAPFRLQRRDANRPAIQAAIEIISPLVPHLLGQPRRRHRQARFTIQQLAIRAAHREKYLIELVDQQHIPGLRGQRQNGLAILNRQLLDDGQRGIEQSAIVSLGCAAQGHPVSGDGTRQQQQQHGRQQPAQQQEAQARLGHCPLYAAFPGSNRGRARYG